MKLKITSISPLRAKEINSLGETETSGGFLYSREQWQQAEQSLKEYLIVSDDGVEDKIYSLFNHYSPESVQLQSEEGQMWLHGCKIGYTAAKQSHFTGEDIRKCWNEAKKYWRDRTKGVNFIDPSFEDFLTTIHPIYKIGDIIEAEIIDGIAKIITL